MLAAVLRDEAELVAFCLDYFPVVARDFASGQTRTQRENLLLERESPSDIAAKLAEREPQAVSAWLNSSRAAVPTAPSLAPYAEAPRQALVDGVWRALLKERRLLLLAPQRGGARMLARQVVTASGLRPEAVTWLAPAAAAATVNSYFASLTQEPRVRSADDYTAWQRQRAAGQRRHLIVLMHDGGPEKGLRQLAAALRGLMHDAQGIFHILAVGGARAAQLRFEVDNLSLFSGVRVERVPDLTVAEVAQVAGLAPHSESAQALQRATGGHPGLLRDVLEAGPLPSEDQALEAEATRRLMDDPRLAGGLDYRIQQDDRDKQKLRHAALVLEALLKGVPVRRLNESGIADHFKWGEVRLHYDGLVRLGADGQTELRCAAVQNLAQIAVRNWREGQR